MLFRSAERVAGARDLSAFWGRMLADPAAAAEMGSRARQVVAGHAEVPRRTWALIEPVLRDYGRGVPCAAPPLP